MLSHLKIHVILCVDIVVVMLLCSMLAINDDVLYCIALHCIALRCVALRCVALRCVALRCVALRCVALRCVALRCVALCCVVLCCIVLYCIVLICLDPVRSTGNLSSVSNNLYLFSAFRTRPYSMDLVMTWQVQTF